MTQRSLSLSDGSHWTLVQAFSVGGAGEEAARLAEGDRVRVVATPSGGEQTVRLELPPDWADLDDDRLEAALASAR